MNSARICRGTVVLLCFAVMSVPALADDPIDRFRHAQGLMQDNELESALSAFSDLRAMYPNDVDYALARAQVLERLGRDDDALQELADAAELAPGYEAVWRLRLLILARQTGATYQSELDAVRQESARRFPQSTWWLAPANPPQWTLLAGGAYDDLSDRLPSWNNQFAEVSREVKGDSQFGIRITRNERYSEADRALGLRAERSFSSGWFAGAALAIADSPAFQPELGYSIHAGRPFADGWVGGISYRRREYATATVGSVTGSIERYVRDFRLAYRLSHSHLHGASGFQGHAVTADWYVSERSSAGVTISTGKEAEALGNGQVLESDVSGVSFSGRFQMTGRVGLQWWLGIHEQGDFYRRRFLGMAVSIKL